MIDRGYQGFDALESEDSSSPFLRTIGIGAVGGALFYGNRTMLRTHPEYAQKLLNIAKKFEEGTPNNIGSTFGFSERASSYTVGKLHFERSQLYRDGRLTDLGSHFQRVLGDHLDVSQIGEAGLRFNRAETGSPFLHLEGQENIRVRFSTAGGRMAGSSFRYNAPLKARPWSFNFEETTWKNFHSWREAQKPQNFHGGAQGFAPWYSNIEGEHVQNMRRAVGQQAFELFERPQNSLFSEFGAGLKQGSYNKIFHVPFVGEGGLINGLLTRRVLPVALGIAGLGYLDYKLGHRPSNAAVNLGLRANVFRADLTDEIPGARKLTDKYTNLVPGPQYGPLALPAAGIFVGGVLHMTDVWRGKYSAGDAISRSLRKAEGRVSPELSTLKRALKAEGGAAEISRALWSSFGKPGKGALIGLAAMIPFIPGMLGSRKTGTELRRIYSGEQDVPIHQGRWWEVGETKFEGGRITSWRPHASVLWKSRAKVKSLYGSEENYWAHNPILHPLRYLKDPYYLEKLHYADRPYSITSPAFSNIPLVGPLLASTIGKVIKPVHRMHEGEGSDEDYTLYSNRLEPRGADALKPAKPREEFGFRDTFKKETRIMAEFIGLPGFIMKSLWGQVYQDRSKGQEVYLQGSRQMDSWARQYYERDLGAGMMMSPETENGFVGYTEALRRFVQHEGFSPQVNEIRNTMPGWMPGDDYMINFLKGDPYTRVDDGYARLPGAGYAALHPELEGVDPAEYPEIEKLRILGDVAPYSRQYQRARALVEKQTHNDPTLRADYEQILEQVRQAKDSTLDVDKRHFNAPVDTLEGTVKSVSSKGITLEEMPGRTFSFSSVGSSMADLVADMLGKQNALTRESASQIADSKLKERDQWLSDTLASGSHVRLTIPKGSAENSQHIQAVIEGDMGNVNQSLIDRGYGRFRKDLGGAEQQAMFGTKGQALGQFAEEVSFEGDNSRWNPLRYIPTPFHTKFWQERTAYSQYKQQEVIGTRMRRWERPIHDFLAPYFRGATERVTGQVQVSSEHQHNRDLNTLTDILGYLRGLKGVAEDPEHRARHTSQIRRSAIGANLFGPASLVGSTLPDREARYFRRFVDETDPDVRSKILEIVPDETRRALEAQWAKQKEAIAEAEGKAPTVLGSEGRLYTKDDESAYKQAKTKLGLGDWLRSREIASFFSRTGFTLPDSDSPALDDALDYQDVKLKIVQQEGYEAHDFNLFDDRASVLWRKPYVDGAVRELTSGESRSDEQLRQAVEALMQEAGNKNPDVRSQSTAAHKSNSRVRVDVELDDEQELLTDLRRNPEDYQS